MTTSAPARPRGRPRSESRRAAILQAAGELMLESGLAGATVEGIAARAGVSKATIYKWWPSRGAVALDGFLASAVHTLDVPQDAPVADALYVQVAALIELFTTTPAGPLLVSLICDAQADSEIGSALRERWVAPRRAVATDTVRRAVERGELRADVDVEALLDALYAPIYWRLLTGHASLDDALARTLVDQALAGVATSTPKPRSTRSTGPTRKTPRR